MRQEAVHPEERAAVRPVEARPNEVAEAVERPPHVVDKGSHRRRNNRLHSAKLGKT